MKKLGALLVGALCLALMSGCSPIPSEKIIEEPEDQVPAVQTPVDPEAEAERASMEYKLKLETSEKEYMEKRAAAIEEAVAQNKEEASAGEEGRISRDKEEQKLFNSKIAALEESEMTSLEVINKRDMDSISLEYKTEMERIRKEYEAKLQKIRKEYDLKVEKINRDFEDRPYEWDSMEEELKAAEEARFSQEYEAKTARINQEYSAAQIKAESEKAVQKSAGERVLAQENKAGQRRRSVDGIIRDYEEKVKGAKASRDGNKEAFKESCGIKHDEAYSKLSPEERMTDSIWEKVVSREKQELLDYFRSEDKKYEDYIAEIGALKRESIEKILK